MSHLSEHPFCHYFSSAQVKALEAIAEPASYEPDDFLLRAGHDADQVFLIWAGHVSLEINGRILQTLGPGDMVGISWLEPPYRWKFDARAVERTRTVRLDAEAVRDLLARDEAMASRVYRQINKALSQRLEAARLQLLDLYGARR